MKRKIVMALLMTMLAAGTFTGCGNKMGGDGKVQAAAAEAGSDQGESDSPEDKPESSESTSTAAPDSAKESQADGGATQEDNADSPTGTKEEKEESYTYSEMDNVVMYAKTGVDVRDLPAASGNKVMRLTKGQEVTVTGKCVETGWYRIVVDGKEMYVSSSYITADKPSASSTGSGSSQTDQTGQTGTTQTTNQNQQGTGTTETTSTSNDVSTAFIDYLNQQRAAAGLSQVTWDSGLAAGAKTRAVEISTYFEHDLRFNAFENILGVESSFVADWYNQWYGSDIHRQAMMNPNLTSAAAAFYEVDGYYYVVFLAYSETPVMSADEWNEAKDNGEVNQLTSVDDGAGWDSYGTEGVEVVTDEETIADVDAALRAAGLL